MTPYQEDLHTIYCALKEILATSQNNSSCPKILSRYQRNSYGICSLVKVYTETYTYRFMSFTVLRGKLKKYYKRFPYYSTNATYPVSPTVRKTKNRFHVAQLAFDIHFQKSKWDGEYGAIRRNFLLYLLDMISHELNRKGIKVRKFYYTRFAYLEQYINP